MPKPAQPRKRERSGDTIQLCFRFPRALVTKIEAHAARMRRSESALLRMSEVSRSDAARDLLVLGIKAVEEAEAKEAEGRKP